MSFDRKLLPDPAKYFEQQGLKLAGPLRAKWKDTECRFHDGKSMRINVETGAWKCMNCGVKGGDVLAYEMQITGESFVEAARALGAYIEEDGERSTPRDPLPIAKPVEKKAHDKLRTTLSDGGWRIWRDCLPISGIALEYLKHRNCVIPPADGDLRWHRALRHPITGYVGPALVALVTSAKTNEAMSLHQTWITPTGKVDLGVYESGKKIPARLYFAGHSLKEACIRLWPDEAVEMGLGIAEGIESSLSLAHAIQPVWACMDSPRLHEFPALPGIECLTIAVDADPAGREASDACAERWLEAGKEVFFVPPSKGDINDLVGEEE